MPKLSNRWQFQDRNLQDFVVSVLSLLNGNLDSTNVPLLAGISGSRPVAKQFTQTFNATTHWGSASGGYYNISFAHNLGNLAVVVFVFDLTTGQIATQTDRVSVTDLNTVVIRTLSAPDLRFAGRVVILG